MEVDVGRREGWAAMLFCGEWEKDRVVVRLCRMCTVGRRSCGGSCRKHQSNSVLTSVVLSSSLLFSPLILLEVEWYQGSN